MAGLSFMPLLRRIGGRLSPTAPHDGSDGQLLDRFVTAREEGAFTTLLQRYGPMVLHVCRRVLPEQHDAEDVFQATFLLLVKKAASIRKRESVASWLHGTAYRLAVHLRRQSARRKELEQERAAPVPPPREPGYEAAWRELQAVLDEELAQLPDRYQAPLLLCYFQGKTHEEAARQLGWPLGTVRSRVARARDALRARLERRGLAMPAALFGVALATRTASAVVSDSLARSTTAAVLALAAGRPAACLVSAQAAALTEGALNTLTTAKCSLGLALLLSAGTVLASLAGPVLVPAPGGAGDDRPSAARAVAKDKEATKSQRDGLGDPLPPGARARLGSPRLFAGAFGQPSFSPDSKAVVTSDSRGGLHFWDVASGRELRRLDPATVANPQQPGLAVPAQLTFSPDGKQVASLHGQSEIHLRDVATGKPVRKFENQGGEFRFFALSPDGKCLAVLGAGQEHNKVRVWDLTTGKPLAAFALPTDRLNFFGGGLPQCLAFSPDSKQGAVGVGDGTVRVWEVATGKEVRKLEGHRSEVASLAFAPDGKALASVGPDGFIRLWDVTTGEQIRNWEPRGLGRQFSPSGLTFADGGKRLVLSGTSRARAWQVDTGKEVPLRGPELSADVAPEAVPCQNSTFRALQGLSPDGKVLATAQPNMRLQLHNPTTGEELHAFSGHEGSITSVAISSSGVIATGGNDRTVRLWDGASGKQLRVLHGHIGPVSHLAFSPDGKRLASAGSNDRVISLWDVATGKEVRQIRWASFLAGLAFVADGKQLMALGTETVWDTATGKQLRQLKDAIGSPSTLAPDSRLLASLRHVLSNANQGTPARSIVLTDPSSGKEIGTFKAARPGRQDEQACAVTSLAISPDARTLLAYYAGQNSEFILFDTASGRPVRGVARPGVRCCAVSVGVPVFTPDGRLVIHAGQRGKIHLLEIASGQDRRVIDPGHANLTALALSPDGKTLVTAGNDGTALLWDLSVPGVSLKAEPASRDFDSLWAEMGGDAPKAAQAMGAFASAPARTVPYLRGKVRRAVPPDVGCIERLIGNLDSRCMNVRKAAEDELDRTGLAARASLEKALRSKPSLHVAKRLEALLGKLEGSPLPPATIQQLRALEVLEAIATPEAQQLIQRLTSGTEGDPLTVEARAALERLKRRAS